MTHNKWLNDGKFSGSLAASDGNKKNNSHAGMSHTSKISDAKNSESLSRDDDSLSQFSEGVGENKMQVNQRKVSFERA